MMVRLGRISKAKQNRLLRSFVADINATLAAHDANVSRDCSNRYYRHFRELIYKNSQIPRFSGEVDIDQTEFGGRRRKKMIALLKPLQDTLTYKQYRQKAKEILKENKVMVLGIRQRGGPVYIQIIEKGNKETLQPIIQAIVEPGSIVYTDEWRGFGDLNLIGYKHKTVNHSEGWVAKDGSHTNGIESFWSVAKRRTRKFNGIAHATLPLHLKECEFRHNHKEDLEKSLKQLLNSSI